MDFLFTYHPGWLFLAVLLAFSYAFFLYRKDALLEEVKRTIKIALAVFRFISVFILLLLLLGVIIENFTERKEKPLLFVVNDNSASILLAKDSTYYKEKYLEELNNFSSNLTEDFEVQNYSFASTLETGFNSNYQGKLTDLSTVFNTIFDQYTNRNIGGIVLASDGIYNAGANPIYAIARKSFLPIFTIGLGDTIAVKDVRIDQVNHNDIAFLGNDYPVEIAFSQTKCQGETISVGIYDGERLLQEKKITFDAKEGQGKLQFIIKADKVGFRKLRAEISTVENEYSLKNNNANFYVEVIDGRQKILIASSAPHPDISALRSVIDQNKNYEVTIQPIAEVENVSPYDLIVVHNYINESKTLNDYLLNGVGPALYIVGGNADLAALEKMKIGFSGRSSETEETSFAHNGNFKEILISPDNIQLLSSSPPLQAPFGNIKFSNAIEILAYQKVGSIRLDQPLIYFTQKQNSRIGVVMGEGIWRWRLNDQLKNRKTANFNAFFGKLITYLAVKENKDPFRITLENEYNENESVLVKAELYNKSFERINEPEVEFTFINENDENFESFFIKTSDAYQLDLGKLPQGVYNWEAKTVFQEKEYTKTGTFLVRELKLEYLNSVADHRILRNIASSSGGSFHFPNELNDLSQIIKEREDMVTVVYQEKEFDDLIDYKWLFILIMLFLSIEWFARKYLGAY